MNGHVSNVETTPFPTKDAKHVYKGDVLVDGKLVGAGETLTFKIQWSHDKMLDGENQKVTVVEAARGHGAHRWHHPAQRHVRPQGGDHHLDFR